MFLYLFLGENNTVWLLSLGSVITAIKPDKEASKKVPCTFHLEPRLLGGPLRTTSVWCLAGDRLLSDHIDCVIKGVCVSRVVDSAGRPAVCREFTRGNAVGWLSKGNHL